MVAHQNEKDLKGLRRQRNRLTGTQQNFLLRVDPEKTKLVKFFQPLALAHRHSERPHDAIKQRILARWGLPSTFSTSRREQSELPCFLVVTSPARN